MSISNNTIFAHHYQEFKKSFVDDRLIELNVHSIEGFEAQQKYFESWQGERLSSGAPAGRLIEKTNHLLAGAWFVYTETISGMVPHFKPDKPRIINEKSIKYEQVKSSNNGTFLPRLTYYHVKLIAESYFIDRYPEGENDDWCEEAWKWIEKQENITIGITEGWKKTLALASVGIPTIGISGIWNFNNSSLDKSLLPSFYLFKNHKFCFYYDNDKKEKTIKAVKAAMSKLSRQLYLADISRDFEKCTWVDSDCKGIDDYLYQYKGNTKYLKYEPLILGQKFRKVSGDLNLTQEYLTTDSRECCQEIVNAITNNKLTIICSPKGSAKTEAISEYTSRFQSEGTEILVPTHRVQLMHELSKRFQIANASNHTTSLDKVFGLSVCIDSMHANSSIKFNVEQYSGCILVIDEIDQVLDHLISAKTEVRKRRSEIIKNFIQLLQNAQKVIAASADITQDVVDFLEFNCKEKSCVIVNEYRKKSGDCTIYTQSQPETFLNNFFKAIDNGKKVMLFTSSQKITSSYSTQNLEILLEQKYNKARIFRIDAETVANPERKEYLCMQNINGFIDREKPDVLLISPVLETGIDITSKHFDEYWGMNWGVSSVNSFSQAMGRIRLPIPRYIWSSNSSPFSTGNGSYFDSGLIKSQHHQILVHSLIFCSFNKELEWYTNDSCLRYWAERGAIANTYNSRLVKSVIAKFASDYENTHIYEENLEKAEKKIISEKIKSNKKANTEERYQQIITAPYVGNEKFNRLLDKKEKTLNDRCVERKNSLIRYITPVSHQCEINEDLLKAQDDGFLPKISLYWFLQQGIEITHKYDCVKSQKEEFILDLNNKLLGTKVLYLTKFKILNIIENPAELYYSKHPLIVEVGANIRMGFNKPIDAQTTIKDLWGVKSLSGKSLDINLVKWCLEVLGFSLKLSKRTTKAYFYSVSDSVKEIRKLIIDFWNTEKLDFLDRLDNERF